MNDKDLGAALQPLIQAQNEARDAALEQARIGAELLKEQQQQSLYALRKAKAAEELSSHAGQSVQEVRSLKLATEYMASEVRELTRAIEEGFNQLHYVLSLVLEINRLRISGVKTSEDKEKLSGLIKEIDQLDFDLVETEELSLRKRLKWLNKTLGELRIREAMHGINVPVGILNEIDDLQTKIAQTERELQQLLEKRANVP